MTIMETPLKEPKGVYVFTEDLPPYIFFNRDLSGEMHNIVILHEIGHHLLRREIANTFHETNQFDMSTHNMEYEANLFATQIMLPDNDTIELI